jgi:hypothetical protein
LPTSELTRLQSSWWNAAIIGAEIAIAIATYGTASYATTSAQASAKKAMELASQAALDASNDMILGLGTMKTVLKAQQALSAANIAYNSSLTSKTFYMVAAGVDVASVPGVNGLGYISSTIGNKARREPTWIMKGQWLLTENKHTIYHMFVKDVENKENVTLYNDIGSAYNYKTVAIGDQAFHNKDNIKTINFRDVNTGEMYAPMTILIPDSAFVGCKNLETLDLIMFSNYTNRLVPLGPENFIVCGEDIFAGCDTTKLKIRIGADKYEEFAENTFWGKYKNCFEVVDVPEEVDFEDFGAQ